MKCKRKRMGKGELAFFDGKMESAINSLYETLGYYPSMRQIADDMGVTSINIVASSLSRLVKNGRLSQDAQKIYRGKKHEKRNKKQND